MWKYFEERNVDGKPKMSCIADKDKCNWSTAMNQSSAMRNHLAKSHRHAWQSVLDEENENPATAPKPKRQNLGNAVVQTKVM